MNQDEIYKIVSERTGYPEEQVKFVIEDLFGQIKYYLTNPIESGFKIDFCNCFKFGFMPSKIRTEIKKADFSAQHGKRLPYVQRNRLRKQYLSILLKNILDYPRYNKQLRYARQTKKSNLNG